MRQLQAVGFPGELQLVNVYIGDAVLRSRQDIAPTPPEGPIRWRVTPVVGARLVNEHELRFRVHVKLEYEEDSPKPYDLELSIIGVYQSKSPIDQEQVKSYQRTHSLPLLWPYLREAISSLTVRMGGPSMILPTMNVRFEEITKPKATQATRDANGAPHQDVRRDVGDEATAGKRVQRQRANRKSPNAGS